LSLKGLRGVGTVNTPPEKKQKGFNVADFVLTGLNSDSDSLNERRATSNRVVELALCRRTGW